MYDLLLNMSLYFMKQKGKFYTYIDAMRQLPQFDFKLRCDDPT